MADILYDTTLAEAYASRPTTMGRRLEDEAGYACDALRHFARIVWWDGSAIGLRLNGFIGLFGGFEPDPGRDAREELE